MSSGVSLAFLPLCFLFCLCRGSGLQNITLLYNFFPDKLNTVPCQRITDIKHQPILTSAESFEVPVGAKCSSLRSAVAMETRSYDSLPSSAHVALHETVFPNDGDVSRAAPDNQVVAEWVFSKPNDGWGTMALSQKIYEFTMDLGELQLSEGMYWLSFYVSMDRDPMVSGYRDNFARCATSELAIDPQRSLYYFKDYSNLLKHGFETWTIAAAAEPLLGINSVSKRLAVNVTGECWFPDFATPMPTTHTTTPTKTRMPSTHTTTPAKTPVPSTTSRPNSVTPRIQNSTSTPFVTPTPNVTVTPSIRLTNDLREPGYVNLSRGLLVVVLCVIFGLMCLSIVLVVVNIAIKTRCCAVRDGQYKTVKLTLMEYVNDSGKNVLFDPPNNGQNTPARQPTPTTTVPNNTRKKESRFVDQTER